MVQRVHIQLRAGRGNPRESATYVHEHWVQLQRNQNRKRARTRAETEHLAPCGWTNEPNEATMMLRRLNMGLETGMILVP